MVHYPPNFPNRSRHFGLQLVDLPDCGSLGALLSIAPHARGVRFRARMNIYTSSQTPINEKRCVNVVSYLGRYFIFAWDVGSFDK